MRDSAISCKRGGSCAFFSMLRKPPLRLLNQSIFEEGDKAVMPDLMQE